MKAKDKATAERVRREIARYILEDVPEMPSACKLALRRLEYLLAEDTGPCPACEALRKVIAKAEDK